MCICFIFWSSFYWNYCSLVPVFVILSIFVHVFVFGILLYGGNKEIYLSNYVIKKTAINCIKKN